MVKFMMQEGERLLLGKDASCVAKTAMDLYAKPRPGKLFVTTKRIAFQTTGGFPPQFECELSEIESFSVGMFKTIHLKAKDGRQYTITGMFNKSLIQAMLQVGIEEV